MACCKISNLDIIVLLCFLVTSGVQIYGLQYDYSFTHECLESPLKAQYGGGIIENPEMNEGVKGWSLFGGNGKLAERKSEDGNSFIVTFDRIASNQSLSQKFDLKKGVHYTISAWLQVGNGEAHIFAVIKTSMGIQRVGSTIARSGCWSMLKGGLIGETSGPALLYFDTDQSTAELWADSISVQPFTEDEWRSHQTESIETVRKSQVVFQAVDSKGRALRNANVSIRAIRPDFPFGAAISGYILKNTNYQDWFFKRFKYTVFENEMKWLLTEFSQGHEDYSVPDAMIKLMQQKNVQVRGHNILWDEIDRNPLWVQPLKGIQLKQAADKRVNSIVKRYQGQVIHWDVVNENMHTSFLEDSLNDKAGSAKFYTEVNQLDSKPTPFLNEYFTIEDPNDQKASPSQYINKINQMRSDGYKGPLGIGLQGHFKIINLPYLRSGLDSLTKQNLPIWITELTVQGSNLGPALDTVMRELIAHPSVRGILLWAAMSPTGCAVMCLTDQNFKNLPTGDAVDKIISELTHQGFVAVTDENGFLNASLFHGEYDVHFSHADAVDSPPIVLRGHKVVPMTQENKKLVRVMLPTVM